MDEVEIETEDADVTDGRPTGPGRGAAGMFTNAANFSGTPIREPSFEERVERRLNEMARQLDSLYADLMERQRREWEAAEERRRRARDAWEEFDRLLEGMCSVEPGLREAIDRIARESDG